MQTFGAYYLYAQSTSADGLGICQACSGHIGRCVEYIETIIAVDVFGYYQYALSVVVVAVYDHAFWMIAFSISHTTNMLIGYELTPYYICAKNMSADTLLISHCQQYSLSTVIVGICYLKSKQKPSDVVDN